MGNGQPYDASSISVIYLSLPNFCVEPVLKLTANLCSYMNVRLHYIPRVR